MGKKSICRGGQFFPSPLKKMPGHRWDEANLYKEKHNMNGCGLAIVLVTFSVQIWQRS